MHLRVRDCVTSTLKVQQWQYPVHSSLPERQPEVGLLLLMDHYELSAGTSVAQESPRGHASVHAHTSAAFVCADLPVRVV